MTISLYSGTVSKPGAQHQWVGVVCFTHTARRDDLLMLTVEDIQKKVTGVVAGFNAISMGDKVRRVSLFGSYASSKATDTSDIDLLVEFESEFASCFSLGRLLSDFETALGTTVDIVPFPLPAQSFISIDTVVPLYVEN
jgi:predicted nucleotidyltransferase